ncbi:hypothetical protein SOPP22_13840 [Shewanella sp. OPT22]|nr:hypothetical protein SOPP22_13840 [Shewanella sp. OPT22]
MLNRLIAILLLCLYLLIFTGQFEYYKGFKEATAAIGTVDIGRINSGIIYFYLYAIMSLLFIAFPDVAAEKLSPRTKKFSEIVIKPVIWVYLGYFIAIIIFWYLEAFR